MAAESLNVREAAEALGFSVRSVKRAAQDGSLPYFLTPGKHYRFRRVDLEAFALGVTRRGFEAPASGSLQSRRERIAELNLEGQEIRSRRQLEEIRREDEKEQRQREESARAAEQERVERRHQERVEQEREAAREAATRERVAWENEFLADALSALPRNAPPDVILAASEACRAALAPFDPGQSPQLVAVLVVAAIKRALEPWKRSEEIARIIADAEKALPFPARAIFKPSEWQLRTQAAAAEAIRSLPTDASLCEVRRVAAEAGRSVAADFERTQVEKQHFHDFQFAVELAAFQMLPSDIEAGQRTVRESLARLPIGCGEAIIRKATDRAVAPYARRKEAADQAQLYLGHVGNYIEELGAPDGEWELGDYFERRKLAQRIEKKIRPQVIERLLTDGFEDNDEAEEFIEFLVDEEIESE